MAEVLTKLFNSKWSFDDSGRLMQIEAQCQHWFAGLRFKDEVEELDAASAASQAQNRIRICSHEASHSQTARL
eukprot:3754783-Amphidinium_carterae.1